MPGRTLRDAIAVALEAVPTVELAAGDEMQRAALHDFLLGWVKDYAYNRGVIFEDADLATDLALVVGELRNHVPISKAVAVIEREVKPLTPIDVPCTICNAKIGERCTSLINANKWREAPHSARVALAQKGA